MARKNQKIIGGYINEERHKKFVEKLKEDGLTPSEFIRLAVEQYVLGSIRMKKTIHITTD